MLNIYNVMFFQSSRSSKSLTNNPAFSLDAQRQWRALLGPPTLVQPKRRPRLRTMPVNITPTMPWHCSSRSLLVVAVAAPQSLLRLTQTIYTHGRRALSATRGPSDALGHHETLWHVICWNIISWSEHLYVYVWGMYVPYHNIQEDADCLRKTCNTYFRVSTLRLSISTYTQRDDDHIA